MRLRTLLLPFLVLWTLVLGCSHEIESPSVTANPGVNSVVPDLVCVEQLTTKVVIHGDGFTPMPQKTLEDKQVLALPTIVLQRMKMLDGASATGSVTLPDDPANPSASRVHWDSEQQMWFEVYPELKVDAGVYDIQVTNPDKKKQATFSGGLVAVPRPVVTAAHPDPDLICTAQGDQTMQVVGTGFLQFGTTYPSVQVGSKIFPGKSTSDCTPVPGTYAEGTLNECKSLTFVIPKGALDPGEYDVVVTNPAPASCSSSQDVVKLRVVPPPTVTSIEPDLVCDAQANQAMTVKGKDFLQVGAALPDIALGTDPANTFKATSAEGCTPIPGNFVEGAVLTCTTLHFTIPMGKLPEGDYAVKVTNPKPADCYSTEAVNLHVAPPPILSSLDKLSICDEQADQTIVLTGSKFLKVGTTLPTVKIGTKTFTPTSAGGCTAIPGTFVEGVVEECTSLTVVIPKGTFTAGDYPVSVTNPLPADCSSTGTLSLKVEDPPVVDSVNPSTVCTGGSSFVISGSGFVAPVKVQLVATGQPTLESVNATVNSGGTEINASFGPGAQVGVTYEVVIVNGNGCTDDPPHKTVTVVPGPMVFFLDPEIVYNGVNTRATVYATALTLPVAGIYITPAGQVAPKTDLVWAAVPGKPNRMQVTIPKDQTPGVYDLYLNDATTCAAFLPNALTVTADLTMTIKSIVPPFGWTQTETAVTIFRDAAAPAPKDKPFVATPRAFLNPTNPQPTDIAIPLESVAFSSPDRLTAVVPKGQPVHVYDLIVVNPDGAVGFLPSAFTVEQLAPPTIDSVTPSSIVAATGQVVKVAGHDFRNSTASLTCDGTAVPSSAIVTAPEVCDANQSCTQQVTIDGSAIPVGSVCVLRITNDDGSYADYSAIGVTGPSLNLSSPKAGKDMIVGRRALSAASGDATEAARFVYAIGGDDGAATPASFDSVEAAPVDFYGAFGDFKMQVYKLGTPRSFAASARVGRYMYVYGGANGATTLASGQRAMILNPREAPALDVDDLALSDVGLDAGYWFYKLSATFGLTDLDNPGGESLPSDEFIVKVPAVAGKKIQVVLKWAAPVDSLGQPLPNVTGYRLYRSPTVNGKSGDEVLIKEITVANQLTYTDDGTTTPGADVPLALGSTGKWVDLPAMGKARKGASGMAATDPADPNTVHVYALLGLDNSATPVALGSYEYLTVTLQANGHQTFAASWTAGTQSSAVGRWQAGAWLVDSTATSLAGPNVEWIYLGGGLLASGNTANRVEAALVGNGGQLGVFDDANVPDFSVKLAGYGVCAANDQLFTFGGVQAGPSPKAKSGKIISPLPHLANNSWNDEGLSMTHGRYLLGSSVQSAFIFLLGGQTDEPSPASKTTELVIW